MLIFQKNFEKKFKYRQDRMLENVLRSRIFDFSYTINMSEDFVDLYNCFLETVKSIFKTCNLIPKNPACYACVIDNRFNHTLWHTHLATSHISAAFYLKQPSEIGFQAESGEFTIKPKEFDMLIFSSKDYHKPIAPKNKDQLRVSLNIETYCKEGINVFNKSNIKEI